MKDKKNILLITSDQQHFFTIGKFNPEIKTPNLDRLCAEGMYFPRAYTVNPTCTPTRATVITGMYPSQHGAWTLGTKLQENVHTIGEDFLNAGYKTALIGKAHFQPLAGTEKYPSVESYPILQDLDFWKNFNENFYGFCDAELARNHTSEAHAGQHYAIWLEENGCANWRDFFLPPTGNLDRSKKYVWEIPEKYHYNAWIAERANSRLEKYFDSGDNFFMWASFFDPHPECLAPEPYASMYDPEKITVNRFLCGEHDLSSPFIKKTQEKNPDFSEYQRSPFNLQGLYSHLHSEREIKKQTAVYYGMITLMDKYIGKILDKLDELGLTESTAVVFTTDHGHFFGQHGLIDKGPFMYEDLIKIPFIVRCPGQSETGTVNGALQSVVDLAETFLSICGLPLPDGTSGVDQSGVWAGTKKSARDWIVCEHNHERGAVNLRTFVDHRYKLTVYLNMEHGDLYDLQEDPCELHNRWNDPAYEKIKAGLMHKFLLAEMEREPKFMPRIWSA
ncbi:MAG: sulfatase-like hydrolase/transferase [Defluviitaleaceae bacterium]|nr:sulfatase-like hydrolase/transferase [Defluviitaleaceae bacterium]